LHTHLALASILMLLYGKFLSLKTCIRWRPLSVLNLMFAASIAHAPAGTPAQLHQ
jgi:hypothetical protein